MQTLGGFMITKAPNVLVDTGSFTGAIGYGLEAATRIARAVDFFSRGFNKLPVLPLPIRVRIGVGPMRVLGEFAGDADRTENCAVAMIEGAGGVYKQVQQRKWFQRLLFADESAFFFVWRTLRQAKQVARLLTPP